LYENGYIKGYSVKFSSRKICNIGGQED